MRQTIVLVLLVCILGGFGALAATRPRTAHRAPAANPPAGLPAANSANPAPSAGASAAASAGPTTSSAA
ncbi:MAG TPA: hypothetical protein PKA58_06195, partial [Polyangium sp.]|nr:hypothetical protein [Polyangium sp.]